MSQKGGTYALNSSQPQAQFPMRYPVGSERNNIATNLLEAGVTMIEQAGHASSPGTNRVKGVQALATLDGVSLETATNAIAIAAAR